MRCFLFFAVLLTTTAVRAEVSSSLAECMSIEPELARVQCYDRVLGRSTNDGVKGSETSDFVDSDRDVRQPEVEVREAVSTPIAAPRSGNDQFGFDEPRDTRPVTAVIEEVKTLPHGQFVLTLDNGQVWREIEARQRARFSAGQPITIRRKRFAYWLTNEDTGFSNRVKRLE